MKDSNIPSRVDSKLPDMTNWSEYRKTTYFKTQLLLSKRDGRRTLPRFMHEEARKYIVF